MLQARMVVVPFDEEMASGAFEAFCRFGKGQGHPAQLNIADCAVYALPHTPFEWSKLDCD
jgi:ribonuclease VapC